MHDHSHDHDDLHSPHGAHGDGPGHHHGHHWGRPGHPRLRAFGGPAGGAGFDPGDGPDVGPGSGPGFGGPGFGGPGFGRPGFGGPGFGGPGFGGPGFGGPGPGGHGSARHGRRARRGDVRAAALLLLAEQPRNGYQIIQELAERTADSWRPSPGSVYPVLAQLEDEGLVTVSAENTGKTFQLSEQGRRYVEDHREALGTPWQDATGGVTSAHWELRRAAHQLISAARQVGAAGEPAQLLEAGRLITECRRSLYRLLAGDAGADQAGADADGAGAGQAGAGDDHPAGPPR